MTRTSEVLPAASPLAREPLLDRVRRKHLELTAVAAMSLLYACSYFHRIAVPGTIFDELQHAFSLDAAGVTALASIYLYVYAILQIPVGFLSDRIGGRRMMLAGGVLLTIGGVLFPLAQVPWHLYLARGLIGLGASTMFLAAVEQIDELFASRTFSYLIGPFTVAGLLGGLTGTLPFERAANAFGWRDVLLGVGLFTGVALIATFVCLRRLRPPVPPSGPVSLRPMWGILANRHSWPVLVGGGLTFAIYFIIQGVIGKKLLADHGGFTSAQAAAITFAMMCCALAFVGSSGLIARLTGHRRKPLILLSGSLLLLTAALGLLALSRSSGTLLAITYLLFAVCSGVGPIYVCAIKELNRPDAVALSVSMGNTTSYLVIAILSHIVGVILDAYTSGATVIGDTTVYPIRAYQTIFTLFAGLSLVVFACACLVRETNGHCIAEASRSR